MLLILWPLVLGLLKGEQAQCAAQEICECGYVCHVRDTTPLTWGCPQSRPRLWFLAFRHDMCAWSTERIGNRIDELHHFLKYGPKFARMDLDSYWLAEDDALVKLAREDALIRIQLKATSANVGMFGDVSVKRKEMAESETGTEVHSKWSHDLLFDFPIYYNVAERERCMLDGVRCEFPERLPSCMQRVSNLSQSRISTSQGLLLASAECCDGLAVCKYCCVHCTSFRGYGHLRYG